LSLPSTFNDESITFTTTIRATAGLACFYAYSGFGVCSSMRCSRSFRFLFVNSFFTNPPSSPPVHTGTVLGPVPATFQTEFFAYFPRVRVFEGGGRVRHDFFCFPNPQILGCRTLAVSRNVYIIHAKRYHTFGYVR